MRTNLGYAYTFLGRDLGIDGVHSISDKLLTGHSLGGGDIDDVQIGVEEENGISNGVDNICT